MDGARRASFIHLDAAPYAQMRFGTGNRNGIGGSCPLGLDQQAVIPTARVLLRARRISFGTDLSSDPTRVPTLE
jgi:hypothetical protein